MVRALIEWIRDTPDPRCGRKTKHDYGETLACIVLGTLAGKNSLRKIQHWCVRNLEALRRHMPLKGGIPSLSTMSRMVAKADSELLSLSAIAWIGAVFNTRGRHLAIDGKAVRGATRKIRGEKVAYMLNAIDTRTKIVVGQIAVGERTNEAAAIPELLKRMEVEGSTVTIDAIGATGKIMEALHEQRADFLLQVKGNCPALYGELMDLFDMLECEKGRDEAAFLKSYGKSISSWSHRESNRERMEYRNVVSWHDEGAMDAFREERPFINSVGRACQVRIKKVQDADGNDITPTLAEFIKNGSRKQPKPEEGDGMGAAIQRTGLISSRIMSAEEMASYKRSHWAVENSLHYVLDETFREDRCTVRKGKFTLAVLRRCAYNIVRLLQMGIYKDLNLVGDVIEEIEANIDIGAAFICKPIPSFY